MLRQILVVAAITIAVLIAVLFGAAGWWSGVVMCLIAGAFLAYGIAKGKAGWLILAAILVVLMSCSGPSAMLDGWQVLFGKSPTKAFSATPATGNDLLSGEVISSSDGDQRSVGPQGFGDRVQHMIELDKVFRTSGVAAWLEAAGMPYNWAPGYLDARQPEEETMAMPDGKAKIVVSGFQVQVRGLYVPYPACLTTDQPDRVLVQSTTRQYTPDPTNGSTLYTNATTAGNGEVTLWVDCSNWHELDPTTQQ